MNEKLDYVYIVRCCDNSLYTGWTTDLKVRIQAHNCGTGAKYTRSRKPVELVYWEALESRSEALKREAAIKKMSREKKVALIDSNHQT